MMAAFLKTLITVLITVVRAHSPPHLWDEGAQFFFFYQHLENIIEAHSKKTLCTNKSAPMVSLWFYY